MAKYTCAPCGERFAGLDSFDHHQLVNYDDPTPVVCLSPADVGLTLDDDGVWVMCPGVPGATGAARFAGMNAAQAAARRARAEAIERRRAA